MDNEKICNRLDEIIALLEKILYEMPRAKDEEIEG